MNLINCLCLFLRGWYRDSHYDVNTLEDCLKNNLRADNCMFDYQHRILVIKVGVITVTIVNVSSVIFINYNRLSARKEDCSKMNVVLRDKRLNNRLEYTYICSEKIENESYIWEVWVFSHCRRIETDLLVIRALQLHLYKCIDIAVRWRVTDSKQFVLISKNQGIWADSEWENEWAQQLHQNYVVEVSVQWSLSFDLWCCDVTQHRCLKNLRVSQKYWILSCDSWQLFISTLTIFYVFL